MGAMVFLTACVLFITFLARARAVKSGALKMSYFKDFSGGTPPEDMVKADNHFRNLFELPVLFYAGCLAAMILRMEGWLLMTCAWIFVVARAAHAAIHIGSNNVRLRMTTYAVGWLAVLGIWIGLLAP